MYAASPVLQTTVFARIPETLRIKGRTNRWIDLQRGVAHIGLGTVWLFSNLGEPLARIRSCAGLATTNLAYGGPDNKLLYITESESGSGSGSVLTVPLEVPGNTMFSHR